MENYNNNLDECNYDALSEINSKYESKSHNLYDIKAHEFFNQCYNIDENC
jgi:hypothetical protein